MKVKILLAILFALSTAAFADLTSTNKLVVGKDVYENYSIIRYTPTQATIRHSTGIATVAITNLPPDIQKQLGYDPQKAQAFQRAEDEAARQRAEIARQKVEEARRKEAEVEAINQAKKTGLFFYGIDRQGTVQQVLPSGYIVSVSGWYNANEGMNRFLPPDMEPYQGNDIFLIDYPNPLAEGEKVMQGWAAENGVVTVNGRTLRRYKWMRN
jgi:hypothetical protein